MVCWVVQWSIDVKLKRKKLQIETEVENYLRCRAEM